MNRGFSSNSGQSWVPSLIDRSGSHPVALRVTFFDAIALSSSFQDLTNDSVPSRCRSAASCSIVDARIAELGDQLLRIAAVGRHKLTQFAVVGESK